MMRRLIRLTLLLATMGVFAPGTLCAQPPTRSRLQLGGGPRYGSSTLNLGLGADAGYTFDMGVYAGAAFDYHLGGRNFDTHPSYWLAYGQGGYDFGLSDRVVLRPVGMVGVLGSTGNYVCSQDLAIGLGGHLFFLLSRSIFFGGVVRVFVNAELDGGELVTAGGQVGVVL